jgi:hypothetical protein
VKVVDVLVVLEKLKPPPVGIVLTTDHVPDPAKLRVPVSVTGSPPQISVVLAVINCDGGGAFETVT